MFAWHEDERAVFPPLPSDPSPMYCTRYVALVPRSETALMATLRRWVNDPPSYRTDEFDDAIRALRPYYVLYTDGEIEMPADKRPSELLVVNVTD